MSAYPYHQDVCDGKGCTAKVHDLEELGACAFCGLIQARHRFELVDWDERGNTVLACRECVEREQLRVD